jgi:hypothetical protein
MRERRTGPPRRGAAVAAVVIVMVLSGVLPVAGPAARAASGRISLQGRAILAPGVDHLRYSMASPRNVIHAVRIKPGANVSVRPVLSNNRVLASGTIPGRETTSSMCRRAGALACVNGDFASCSACDSPLGGVIRHGEVMRSPNPSWPQVWVGPDGMGAGTLRVTGRVVAIYQWQEQVQQELTGVEVPAVPATETKTKSLQLNLAGVNVGRPSDGVVLYTPTYAASTGTPAGGTEVRITVSRSAALDKLVHLQVGAIGTAGNARIPAGTFVLSASGAAEQQLRAFWLEARRYPERLAFAALKVESSVPVTQSLGGHPVILQDGHPLPQAAPTDTASYTRHPRTLVGWNDGGTVWFVTIDGRQAGVSEGVTYWETASVLLQLGATDGVNLDGGGSTTFVAKRCDGRLCVRNHPSDGVERRVSTALAVVPRR